jgi:hypothetical protein
MLHGVSLILTHVVHSGDGQTDMRLCTNTNTHMHIQLPDTFPKMNSAPLEPLNKINEREKGHLFVVFVERSCSTAETVYRTDVVTEQPQRAIMKGQALGEQKSQMIHWLKLI